MKYIIDLDDTLISSTKLNNDAYNYALEQWGFDRINAADRITRDKLKFIKPKPLKNIINTKQSYFNQKWLHCRVTQNFELVKKIKALGHNNCYIWTKADKTRAVYMLHECKLTSYFKNVIFDKKDNILNSIKNIKKLVESDDFIIYENDFSLFSNIKHKVVDIIKSDNFLVKGFTV